MARKLETRFLAGESVKMGRSSGRQAPTMPRDDSIMGQYTVGVRRSVMSSGQHGPGRWSEAYVHVRSSLPSAVSRGIYVLVRYGIAT